MILRGILLLSLLFCLHRAFAQKSVQRFRVGATVGVNVAQIDGDSYAGYRKLGLQVGFQATATIRERFFISTEMLLSQRGARPSRQEILEDFDNYIDIRITYIEIPFLLNIFPGQKKGDYYSFHFFGGVSLGRLIQTDIREVGESVNFYPYLQLNTVKDDFQTFDYSLILGGQMNFSKNVGIFLKHTLTLKGLYSPEGDENPFNPLEPFFFTLGAAYLLY